MRFETYEEMNEYLMERGFKRMDGDYRQLKRALEAYQKVERKRDEGGKLHKAWFINAYVYDWRMPEEDFFTVEFETQLYKKGDHKAVNMTFLDWTYEEVEEHVGRLYGLKFIENYDDDEEEY